MSIWGPAGMHVDLLSVLSAVHGPWVYLVVGLGALLESAAFLGLLVPGETLMLLAGAIAAWGGVSLGGVMAVGAVAAVLGDQLGYVLGRAFGSAMRRGRLGGAVTARHWARAEALVARRGGLAVFLARWVGVMRAVVPAAAGAAGLPRRSFTIWNAVGGALWVVTVAGAGYLAGASWPVVVHWLGTGSLVGAVLLGVAVVLLVGVRLARPRISTTTSR